MDNAFTLTIVNGVAIASVQLRTADGQTHIYRFAIERWLDACMQVTLAAVRRELSWADASWLTLAIHRQKKYHSKVMKGLRR